MEKSEFIRKIEILKTHTRMAILGDEYSQGKAELYNYMLTFAPNHDIKEIGRKLIEMRHNWQVANLTRSDEFDKGAFVAIEAMSRLFDSMYHAN